MAKIKTFNESITKDNGESIEVTISVILEDSNMVAYAVANGNLLPEAEVSSEVLKDEQSKVQTILIDAVRLKLNTLDETELRKFTSGNNIGIRYVFEAEGN